MFKKAHQLWIVRFAEELCDGVAASLVGVHSTNFRHIVGQLTRSADSVGANLVEGYARRSSPDSLRFYSIASGSLEETIFWLRRGILRELISNEAGNKLIERYILLSKSLDSFIRYNQRPKS